MTKSLMTWILHYLQCPTLPLGQVPLFLSNAHFPEHSVQGGAGALSPVLVWSLVPRSPPWPGGHLAAGMQVWLRLCVTTPQAPDGHGSPGARAAQSSRPCQAHPELGQYLLTCWQGKDSGGCIFSSEIEQKDPLDNLYFIYISSIRLQRVW